MTITDGRKIHPTVMYPFAHPANVRHVTALYETLISRLSLNPALYSTPIIILNNQTYHRNKLNLDFDKFFKTCVVRKYSEVIHEWSVDSCQMWLRGLGTCFDASRSDGDVFWLIPGDFNYDSAAGREVLDKFQDLPMQVYTGSCDLCLGEINVEPNSSKQLIDTYGTYGLLYNWFPLQAQTIREITDKPRTEFFAINKPYLMYALDHRWYAYEQTIVILLQGMLGRMKRRKIETIKLGDISDEPQGRDSLG